MALELKHERNQNVHHAVAQFAQRDHAIKIFQHPFVYLAADTSDVMAATDPRREENFRWHNMGLTNSPTNPAEYPVEFLYREVLAPDQLLEALSFFLIRVPEREAEDDRAACPVCTSCGGNRPASRSKASCRCPPSGRPDTFCRYGPCRQSGR